LGGARPSINHNFNNKGYAAQHEQDLVDDFIFSENDTIGTLIHSEYRQDQKIRYKNLKQEKPAPSPTIYQNQTSSKEESATI
jgi:hypothetical protein